MKTNRISMRVARYLASCGLGSRRNCENLITTGRVTVNGEQITSPALDIDPETDQISFDGQIVEPQKKVYYLLFKPIGYTSTLADEHAERLITELVPSNEFVWPVGRLDRETSGLIIMTNDGDLTQKLTHPSYNKSKTYIATIDKPLTNEEFSKLQNGIILDDGQILPDSLKRLEDDCYEITIHEGRNRLVRRMFEYFGRRVVVLTRIKLSFLTTEGLKPGEYREITTEELERLKNA